MGRRRCQSQPHHDTRHGPCKRNSVNPTRKSDIRDDLIRDHRSVRIYICTKGDYQDFLGGLIDLIIELLDLIIKSFDNQTES